MCLQKVVRMHKLAIVTSIHQPNLDILLMFDQLYVLAKGGRCVFNGLPNLLRDHLNKCGIECSDAQIPIEILLKVSSVKHKTKIANLVSPWSKFSLLSLLSCEHYN